VTERDDQEWYAIHESSPTEMLSVLHGITKLTLGQRVDEQAQPATVISEDREPASDPVLTPQGMDIRTVYLGLAEYAPIEDQLEQFVDAAVDHLIDRIVVEGEELQSETDPEA
jgi:hypothetical protein